MSSKTPAPCASSSQWWRGLGIEGNSANPCRRRKPGKPGCPIRKKPTKLQMFWQNVGDVTLRLNMPNLASQDCPTPPGCPPAGLTRLPMGAIELVARWLRPASFCAFWGRSQNVNGAGPATTLFPAGKGQHGSVQSCDLAGALCGQ